MAPLELTPPRRAAQRPLPPPSHSFAGRVSRLAGLVALWLPLEVATSATDVAERRPRYARIRGTIETVWQRPPHPEPKGVFFIAHGCMHQGTDIFSEEGPDGWIFEACSHSNFGRCLGLPEEVRLRQAARARGYVVMAVSGGRGRQSCWDQRGDGAKVAEALEHVLIAEGLPLDAPVLASGASSGGAFMGRLAMPLDSGGLPGLVCIVPQIMGTGGTPNRGIPTLYVHMPRDRRTAATVEMDMEELKAQGIIAEEIAVGPRPVDEGLLQACMTKDLASEVVQSLRAASLLEDSGLLKRDPRTRLWVDIVAGAIAGRSQDSLVADESCIAEVLNVAWAQHEFTAAHAEDMLDFCEQKGSYPKPAVPRPTEL